jgi:hydroxymethylpyrimidine pyrophosphatase-like HAD family hydrolase
LTLVILAPRDGAYSPHTSAGVHLEERAGSRLDVPWGATVSYDGGLDRAADHIHELQRSLAVHTVYADLDGTLLGPRGSLFAAGEEPTGEPAAALVAMAVAGVDLVLASGRTRAQMRDVARTVGARAYIAELGGLLVYRDGREESVLRAPGVTRGRQTAQDAIHRSGAAGFLLDRYVGRLEPHAPWAFVERETSVLLRGLVDLTEARGALRDTGYGWLTLEDNGVIPAAPERFPGLHVEQVRAYHLVPVGVSKRTAVAMDRAHRELATGSCILVGDSVSDAEVAPEVGAVFIVANGRAGLDGVPVGENVYLMDRSHGLGFADAVLPLLPPR